MEFCAAELPSAKLIRFLLVCPFALPKRRMPVFVDKNQATSQELSQGDRALRESCTFEFF
jgi:hypothetical protein